MRSKKVLILKLGEMIEYYTQGKNYKICVSRPILTFGKKLKIWPIHSRKSLEIIFWKRSIFNALIQISFITEIVNITKSTTGNLCNLTHVIIILLLTSLDLKT